MQYNKILLCLFTLGIQTSSIHASCTLGSLTQISTSPFTVGAEPYQIAYSPIIEGNVFAEVSTFAGSSVYFYSVNPSTGAFSAVSGSPVTSGTNTTGVAFSPALFSNLFAIATNEGANTVSVFRVNPATGAITTVSTSISAGSEPSCAAYSPLVYGNLFAAVANFNGDTVSVYAVNTTTGAFTQVPGSPFTVGTGGNYGVAFSPLIAGNLFAAVTNGDSNNVVVYQVNTTTGAFTQVPGSPFTTGTNNRCVAFSPLVTGNLFAAVANQGSNNVSVYQVNTSTGVFTQVPGSPFTAGTTAYGIAFSPLVAGNLFAAVTNQGSNNVSVYQVNTSTGVFTQVSGSPFATGTSPDIPAFSPLMTGGLFLAVSNQSSGHTISIFQVAILMSTITTLSQFILSGNSATINGTISGGTEPYTLYWQDGTIQSGISTTSFSRTVSPTISTVYNIASVIDTNACSAGPSNAITIAVRTCP